EIESAWTASDVGKKDMVTQAHEEGGWVFMDVITGSLSTQRATPEGTNYIRLEPPPDAPGVLVAMFHTHPTPEAKPGPSGEDKKQDKRRGVPNLVAAIRTGTKDLKKFEIYLSGPDARAH